MNNKKFFITVILVLISIAAGIFVFFVKPNGGDTVIVNVIQKSRGNTSDNIKNGGIAASDGEMEYFCKYFLECGLYKTRINDFNMTKIYDDHPKYINFFDGWIYYSNINDKEYIYKIKPDGTCRTKLNDRPSDYLNIVNGWIYFIENDKDLFKMKLDGSEKKKITEDIPSSIYIDDEWIYYANCSDDNKLYRIKTDGTNRRKVCEDIVLEMAAKNGFVYYRDVVKGYLYKIKSDGTERTVLSRDNPYFINLCDDWIYYCKGQEAGDSAHGSIYRIKTDGTLKKKVVSDEDVRSFCIVGKCIYIYHQKYDGESSSTFNIYRVNTSGKNKQIIQ